MLKSRCEKTHTIHQLHGARTEADVCKEKCICEYADYRRIIRG